MIVKCQQQCIFKIRDGIPGHGPQKVLHQSRRNGDRAYLECGCSLPLTWLKKIEQEGVRHEFP